MTSHADFGVSGDPTDEENNRDKRLIKGVALFNARAFFECHDEFEEYWSDLRGSRKICVQGLIQLAVGCYHALNGNFRGAVSQFEKSQAKLTIHSPAIVGLQEEPVRRALGSLLSAASQCLADPGIPFPSEIIPELHWIESLST